MSNNLMRGAESSHRPGGFSDGAGTVQEGHPSPHDGEPSKLVRTTGNSTGSNVRGAMVAGDSIPPRLAQSEARVVVLTPRKVALMSLFAKGAARCTRQDQRR